MLVAAILGLDLLWALTVGSTGALAFGLIDEPAHLATCAVALLALTALSDRRLPLSFTAAALLAAVAIDLDHAPGYLGWDGLIGIAPRPYTHALWPVVALLGLSFSVPRRYRNAMLGLAFGISAHLLRDLATGPGVPLFWPLSGAAVELPYVAFVAALLAAALSPLASMRPFAAGRTAAAAGALLVGGIFAAAAPQPAGAAVSSIATGAFIPGADRDPSLIDKFGQEVGRSPAILSFYRVWGPPLLEQGQLAGAADRGAVPMLTWEPWSEDQVGVSLWSIANGDHDDYLQRSAGEAAAYGQPLLIRFGHEMNGSWYPWGGGVNGNTPFAFKQAWRRIVDIFRTAGATNVRWVWTPYVSNTKPTQFRRFYPGDQWVDWAGFDGFNWGAYGSWQSFKEIFAVTYERLVTLTARPLMIAEMGVNEAGGDKARWITRTLRRVLPRYRHVRAVVWWSAADIRADFRVNSSDRALAALRVGLQNPIFAADAAQLLSVPPLLRGAIPRHQRLKVNRGRR